ncbi:hypothetical protein V7x_30030 [Crateriforma conspicua]|uniref:Uncharacterized protein n=1 Tax=Crateriforma conspicua TaxID=2527996 RepID=A0A5C5XZH3_9PLAN|nr:hypothetical protein Mal65_24120 [Crateriforma conspicua]TWT67959.1 hypothetical protein Pan14r_01970 [Crateriforma conspicua]TWU67429.1 hypothetical protein V7x_30030 [Crateriforma conspicua]
MRTESVLEILPGLTDSQRLVIASESCDSGCSIAPETLVLRHESYSDHVGWFVQSRVSIEPHQFAALRNVITSRGVRAVPHSNGASAAETASPTILKFPHAG